MNTYKIGIELFERSGNRIFKRKIVRITTETDEYKSYSCFYLDNGSMFSTSDCRFFKTVNELKDFYLEQENIRHDEEIGNIKNMSVWEK